MSSCGSTPLAKPPVPSIQVLKTLYDCLDLDKNYLARCIENEKCLRNDQLKRNRSALKKMGESEQGQWMSQRKLRTEVVEDILPQKR